MSKGIRRHRCQICEHAVWCIIALIFLSALVSDSAHAVEPILNLKIEDIVFTPSDSVVTFDLTMNSVEDSVGGLEIILQMSDPFELRFHESDPLDLTGSSIEEWGVVDWTDFGSQGSIIKILGLWPAVQMEKAPLPIPPSDEPQLLLTLRAQLVAPMPETLCGFEGMVIINQYQTRFSTPCEGSMTELIGYDEWIVYDTTFENCVEWDGDSCLAWADTVVEEIPYSAPNFELLNYEDGHYRILCYVCGDADGSGMVDIDDPVFLIGYIFAGGEAPDPPELGDADYNGATDIDDVVYLIVYIFGGGQQPCAVF